MNNVLQRLIDGFSYDGNLKHSVINYLLIAFSLLPYLVKANAAKASSNVWLSVFIISLVIQIINWFVFDVSGVSVIWCCMAGYNFMYILKSGDSMYTDNKILFIVNLLTAIAGIVFYAITLPIITTWAHIIAVLAGAGLFYLLVRRK